jgi:hypothetical protein
LENTGTRGVPRGEVFTTGSGELAMAGCDVTTLKPFGCGFGSGFGSGAGAGGVALATTGAGAAAAAAAV